MLLTPSFVEKNSLLETSDNNTEKDFPLNWGEWFNLISKDNSVQTKDLVVNDYYISV